MSSSRDASSPFRWPPVIYGTAAVVAGGLSWFTPWRFEAAELRMVLMMAGILLGLTTLIVVSLAAVRFKAAGTAVHPTEPTTAIVSSGVYRYTRNPMYLAMSLGLAGLGFSLCCRLPWSP
jgi:protein-S-isoprenylcysteine O-methyltransferase Ste14